MPTIKKNNTQYTDFELRASYCSKGPLSLNNIIKEDMVAVASILYIKCNLCGKINKVKTSSEHRSGQRGRLTFNINSRAVLGSLQAGIGNTHLNNLFATMNVPTMNNRTFKS
ncbi:Hypothetical predicted protein [Paramuricea clavata]|uniref:Mutator-like transposase domain-containing protein n=1 Tax=Paramuricea clavata TaxID=317549 RepID=A0A7D9HJQ5_PARCT|nr:Hypothetical predicted protein [Paramuricea clavata]